MALDTYVLIGLGNPGSKYEATRHNIGRIFLLELLRDYTLTMQPFKKDGHVVWVKHDAGETAIYFPDCYMNDSGPSVMRFVKYYNIPLHNVCVVHDELEKKIGNWGMKCGGSARGHNGLKSIIGCLGSDFWRLGIGIGHPRDQGDNDVSSYVLSHPTPQDKISLQNAFGIIHSCAAMFMVGDFSQVAHVRGQIK